MTDPDLIRELAEALQAVVDLDDGDAPDLWHFEVEFEAARAALTAARERLAREEAADDCVWLRVVDEAMVCAHIGTAEKADDYDTARRKLNNLLAHAQSIGEYFALQSAQPAAVSAQVDDSGPLLDDDGRAMVGASHHYTAENIRSIIADLKECEQGTEVPEWVYRDHRARCGVWWRVIAGLACDVPLAAQPAPEPAEPVALPVGRAFVDNGAVHINPSVRDADDRDALRDGQYVYAAPPSRAPVALSDADLMEIAGMSGWPESMLAPVILAKLREYGRAVEAECRRRTVGE